MFKFDLLSIVNGIYRFRVFQDVYKYTNEAPEETSRNLLELNLETNEVELLLDDETTQWNEKVILSSFATWQETKEYKELI